MIVIGLFAIVAFVSLLAQALGMMWRGISSRTMTGEERRNEFFSGALGVTAIFAAPLLLMIIIGGVTSVGHAAFDREGACQDTVTLHSTLITSDGSTEVPVTYTIDCPSPVTDGE